MIEWKGRTVAVPVGIHHVNRLWINPRALARVGAAVPQDPGGVRPNGGETPRGGNGPHGARRRPRQDATLFETVALSLGGADDVRAALIDDDEGTLASRTTERVFDRVRFLGAMVAVGLEPGRDIPCVPPPGEPGFILDSDSFVMFRPRDANEAEGQARLAGLLLGRRFQETFNLHKGSIPARLDTPMDRFDACARRSRADLENDERTGALVPGVAHEMAGDAATRGAILDTVTEHFNTDMSSAEAVRRPVEAMRIAR